MDFSIAIYGQILDTKINTKYTNWIVRRFFGDFNHAALIHTKRGVGYVLRLPPEG
jgi:hypothetical protein